MQAIQERHSVRAYTGQGIEEEKREKLNGLIQACNEEGRLHIQIQYDNPSGFDSKLAHYGKFRNVTNYMILSGKPALDLPERCGYYGEKLVLEAQKIGLNTCWVALSYNKSIVKAQIPGGDKLIAVIAIGYGETQGVPHRSKSLKNVLETENKTPDWFQKGAKASLLAPTAMNQQKFKIRLKDGEPVIHVSGIGPYRRIDLGIVKYHFEVASGHKVKI